MRLITYVAIVVMIGLLLGGISANFALQRSHGIGAVNAGPWSAWPFVGGVEVDPYTIAKATTDGTIPLGAAEGLAFEAISDQSGDPLRRECDYEISGETSATRAWTLSAYDPDGELVMNQADLLSAIFSGNVTRYPDSSFALTASASPKAGNWIPLSGEGRFKFILRLYDTPITSNSGVIDPQMPRIVNNGCRS